MTKIHIGCGGHKIEGWTNIDRADGRNPDMVWDVVKQKCPFKENSVSFVFSEHVWEHFNLDSGFQVTKTCLKMLKPGGVLRVAVPGLASVLALYESGNWTKRAWMKQMEHPVKTGAVFLNGALRNWNHKFMYDEETLIALMKKAGFKDAYPVTHHKSSYPELRNLEHRHPIFSNLIIEGVK